MWRFQDPYVVLQVVKEEVYIHQGPRGKTTQEGVRSTHRKSTVDPTWNETLLHSVTSADRVVAVQVTVAIAAAPN